MNKKKFSRILAMHSDGVSIQICLSAIIEMSSSTTQAVIWIDKFYQKITTPLFNEINHLKSLLEGAGYDSTFVRKEPSDLADHRRDET